MVVLIEKAERMPGIEPTKFEAFISYSSARSSKLARRLEGHLKRYAKPLFQRPRRIFLDNSHFAPGADLPTQIRRALRDSEYLILLATPSAAESPWVQDELLVWFRDLKRASRFIVVLAEGEIALDQASKRIDWDKTTALPALLADYIERVPLYSDVRGMTSDEDLDLQNPAYKHIVNGLVARIRAVDPNEMLGEEIREHRRTIRIRNGGLVALAALSALLAAASYIAVNQRDDSLSRLLAQESQQPAERIDIALLKAEAASALVESTDSDVAIRRVAEGALFADSVYGVSFPIVSAALDRSGRLLALGGDRGQITVWDTVDRTLVLERELPKTVRIVDVGLVDVDDAIRVFALTDGGNICAAQLDNSVEIRCSESGLETPLLGWRQTGEPGVFVVAHGGARISVVDISSNVVEQQFELPEWLVPISRRITAWDYDAKTSQVAIATADGFVKTYSIDGTGETTVLKAGQFSQIELAFDDTSSALLVAVDGKPLQQWSREEGSVATTWSIRSGQTATVSSVASSDGHLVVAAGDFTVYENSKTAPRELAPLSNLHRSRVSRVLARNGTFVSTSEDGTSIVWRQDRPGMLHDRVVDLPTPESPYSELLFSDDDEAVLVGTDSGQVIAWSMNRDQPTSRQIAQQSIRIRTMSVSSDGRLAFGGQHNSVGIVNPDTGEQTTAPFPDTHDYVNALAFSPVSGSLVVATANGRLEILPKDIGASGEGTSLVIDGDGGHRDTVCCVEFDRGASTLVTADNSGLLISRAPDTGIAISAPRRIHSGIVNKIRATHRADELVSTGMDGWVIIWQLPEIIERCRRRHPGNPIILDAAHATGAPRLATISRSRIVIWDSDSCMPIRQIDFKETAHGAVAISSGGNVVAWSTHETGMSVLELESAEELREFVCARVRITQGVRAFMSASASGAFAARSCRRT